LIGSDPPAPARSVEIGRLPSLGLSITGHLKSSMERRFQSSGDAVLISISQQMPI
jgi:hypothetical protein